MPYSMQLTEHIPNDPPRSLITTMTTDKETLVSVFQEKVSITYFNSATFLSKKFHNCRFAAIFNLNNFKTFTQLKKNNAK